MRPSAAVFVVLGLASAVLGLASAVAGACASFGAAADDATALDAGADTTTATDGNADTGTAVPPADPPVDAGANLLTNGDFELASCTGWNGPPCLPRIRRSTPARTC